MSGSAAAQSIDFVEVVPGRLEALGREWGEKAARHLHLEDGFTISADRAGRSVGLISCCWRELPAPLAGARELYIDLLEVRPADRRQGIARGLVERAIERARQAGVHQVRAWSSADKVEAIPMWRRLGFALCPATTYPMGQEVKGFFVARVLV